MLYLTRKVGETVVINDDIRVTVVEVRGRSIKLGFTFPPNVSVLREELFDRIQEENRTAAGAGADAFGALLQGTVEVRLPAAPAGAGKDDDGTDRGSGDS
ncbi:carbon storage regulator CsrA [Radicibacter daui]|uniref:carbon storage regulator CsrA n=1 Tax=Radicibacter daui TaxID=3064829 RepID=UPI004046B2E6